MRVEGREGGREGGVWIVRAVQYTLPVCKAVHYRT